MGKLVLYSISLYAFILSAYCQDELVILHNPPAMTFESTTDELNRSNLKHVIATAMGYSVGKTDEWSGLQVTKPFGWAKGVYVFHLPGVKLFDSETNDHYSVNPDEKIEETWNLLMEDTVKRYPDERLEMKKVILGDKPKVYASQESPYDIDVSSNGPIKSINSSRPNSENDIMFIQELNKLHSLTDKLLSKSNKNGKRDLFWVTVPNIGQIMALGDVDLKDILMNALKTLSNEIKETYNDEVLIVLLTEDRNLKRSKRQTTEEKPTLISLNVAEDYDEDFPVIFNIVFWFSLAMLFAVLAICLVIGGMDPGRDSIIYRMTNTRMKKDN